MNTDLQAALVAEQYDVTKAIKIQPDQVPGIINNGMNREPSKEVNIGGTIIAPDKPYLVVRSESTYSAVLPNLQIKPIWRWTTSDLHFGEPTYAQGKRRTSDFTMPDFAKRTFVNIDCVDVPDTAERPQMAILQDNGVFYMDQVDSKDHGFLAMRFLKEAGYDVSGYEEIKGDETLQESFVVSIRDVDIEISRFRTRDIKYADNFIINTDVPANDSLERRLRRIIGKKLEQTSGRRVLSYRDDFSHCYKVLKELVK